MAIKFILASFKFLWEKYPKVKLRMTGFNANDNRARWLIDYLNNDILFSTNVMLCGYLTREQLFDYYQSAEGLLIPLFEDTTSKARFPTKLGEYLSSSRPIITCNIGEMSKYFIDGVNALISSSVSTREFAEKICYVEDNPDRAIAIGKMGKELAKSKFDYQIYSDVLNTLFI